MRSKSLMKLFGMDKPAEGMGMDGVIREMTKRSKLPRGVLFHQDGHIIRNEHDFQEKIVIPRLKEKGHEIKEEFYVDYDLPLRPIIDVFSILNGKNYFTEIKVRLDLNHLQKAVGQLTLHQLLREHDDASCFKRDVYQIVFPNFHKYRKVVPPQLCQSLLKKRHIRILFF